VTNGPIGMGPRGAWAVLLAYVILIFYLSSRSHLPAPREIPHWDKLAHLIEYGILGYLSQRAARLTWPTTRSAAALRRLLGVWIAGLCVAAADEMFQSMVPNREPSHLDFAADAAGLMVGLVLNWRQAVFRPGAGPTRRKGNDDHAQ
jgi:VanZ family protein